MHLETAKALAYAYLNRRERTTWEMRQHLLIRGADEQVAATVLRELTEEGYLDDERFARLFTQDKRELSGWGSGRIRRALRARGIAPDVAESALEDASASAETSAGPDGTEPAPSELDRALAVLRQRLPNPHPDGRESRRALGVLLRKGYDYDLAVDALAEHAREVGGAIAPPRPRY